MPPFPDIPHSASDSRKPLLPPQNFQLPLELPMEIRDDLLALQAHTGDLYAGQLDQLYDGNDIQFE